MTRIGKSDAVFRRLRQPLLWLLCLSLGAWAAPARAVEFVDYAHMLVQAPSSADVQDAGYGERGWAVAGEAVTLTPKGTETGQDFQWETYPDRVPLGSGSSLVVSSDSAGSLTYQCDFTEPDFPARALVTVLFAYPPHMDLALSQESGPSVLVPGASFDYSATANPPAPYTGCTPDYVWKVVNAQGQEIPPGDIYTLTGSGNTATLALNDVADAWVLNGARVSCTASLAQNHLVTATASSDALSVGIKVEPAEGEPDTPVPAAPVNGSVSADLHLTSVTGGNASADRLAYQWQWRNQGAPAWNDVGGTGSDKRTFIVDVPASQWTSDRAYRCVVSGDTEGAVSGLFDVVSTDVALILSDDVTLDPANGVALNGGAIDVTGTILVPANRLVAPEKTVYEQSIEVLSDDASWQTMPGSSATETKMMNAGELLPAVFTPLKGSHRYRMTASSDAGDRAVGHSGSFRAALVYTGDVRVWGTSDPASDDQGHIVVDAGKPIVYTVRMSGGTDRWSVTWPDGAGTNVDDPNAEASWSDDAPVNGKALTAAVWVVGYDGTAVTGPFNVAFDAPLVTLAWDMTLSGVEIGRDALSGDRPADVATLAAKGGYGHYRYSYLVAYSGSPQPAPDDSGWKSLDSDILSLKESDFTPGIFDDGLTHHFTVWLKAQDIVTGMIPQQTIFKPLALTVVQQSTLMIESSGGRLTRADDACTATYNQNFIPTLSARLISSDCDTPTFRWELDGTTTDGDTWTPPALEAPDAGAPPYQVDVRALSGDVPLSDTDTIVNLDIRPALSVDAAFMKPSVLPGTEAVLKFEVTGAGSGLDNLAFAAGFEGGGLRKIDAGNGSSFNLDLQAPSTPGVYTYDWTVSDTATWCCVTGQAVDLTVLDAGGVRYRIRPERGAELVAGGSFDMTLESFGTPEVGPGDMKWSSDNRAVATVDDSGQVSLQGPGAVKITATLTASDDISATSNFTVRKASDMENIVVPKLDYAPGATVNAQFTATLSGATLTEVGLPDGLQLSETGALTGTAPQDPGDYRFTVTAAWPNSDTKTVDATLHVTGGGGDSGGGCNGGFGLLALALLAIPALRRQGS